MAQEILIPSANNVKDEVLFSNKSKAIIGDGFFPISYTKANYYLPNKDTLKERNWVIRKMFKEHFVQIVKDKYFLAIDPLFNVAIGKDALQSENSYLYQNTRGAQAFGSIQGILSFYTAFYENQARFSEFQNEYFKDRGELYPTASGYTKDNAVIPSGGRTKPFKTDGFDYASAVSYVRLTPIKELVIQFGNMPRFFGWGYRSMLLSDNSYNYTHLAIDWEIAPGLTYTFMRGKQLNLSRKKHTSFVEKPYERKGIGVHYLSYRVFPSLVIGLFESTIYLRDEAESSQRVNPVFYNPIIGLNTVVKGFEKVDVKNILGLNAAWKFHPQHMVYLQAVSDQLKKFEFGFQLGYKVGNLFNVDHLNFQLEYNQATNSLYAAENQRMAYTHFNLPLAHTLGNGFKELVVRANYKWKSIYIDASAVYYRANQTMKDKSNLFQSKSIAGTENLVNVFNGNVELGYEFNPATQFRAFVSANYRRANSANEGLSSQGIIMIGMRSALTNRYFDF